MVILENKSAMLYEVKFIVVSKYDWVDKMCIIEAENEESAKERLHKWFSKSKCETQDIMCCSIKIKQLFRGEYGVYVSNLFAE